MPCASVTWEQLFSLVEKVLISSPARMHSGRWKLVGTSGLSKTMGAVGPEDNSCKVGGGTQGFLRRCHVS